MRFTIKFFVALTACVAALAQGPTYGRGRTPTSREIQAWDISIGPQGQGLPPGSGTVQEGARLFAQKCPACHGRTGTEAKFYGGVLVGGRGTLTSPRPLRTIGSYWPFATTVFDYINRAMPQGQEGTLKPDEVYALTAFLLYQNGVIKETEVMDAKTLPKVQMPNRYGFYPPDPNWWKPGVAKPFGFTP